MDSVYCGPPLSSHACGRKHTNLLSIWMLLTSLFEYIDIGQLNLQNPFVNTAKFDVKECNVIVFIVSP